MLFYYTTRQKQSNVTTRQKTIECFNNTSKSHIPAVASCIFKAHYIILKHGRHNYTDISCLMIGPQMALLLWRNNAMIHTLVRRNYLYLDRRHFIACTVLLKLLNWTVVGELYLPTLCWNFVNRFYIITTILTIRITGQHNYWLRYYSIDCVFKHVYWAV